MINAHRTGAYISRLRKGKDWTQLELAERLHVTHQAVSQWEKGASFPDIGLLPPLARLLGVSVDDLLNGEPARAGARVSPGRIVEGFARGNPQEVAQMVQYAPEGVASMLEAAPLARPSQLNEVVASLGGLAFTLDQAIRLAPFISQEALSALLDRAAVDQVDAERLVELAPFAGDETLDRLAQKLTNGSLDDDQLVSLAPFLRQATLKTLVWRRLEAGQPLPPDPVRHLAPFVDEDVLEALLQRLPPGPLPIEDLVGLAPFVSTATVDRLAGQLEDPAVLSHYLEELAPFLSQARLTEAVVRFKDSVDAETLVGLAPFLDTATLDGILRAEERP
jgi:transcriptional regulator with XRE-family HTH domain